MAEKKPSIYDDRSTIGSSSELDEYGVWVKIEPQDLSFAGAGGPGAFGSAVRETDAPPDFGEEGELSLGTEGEEISALDMSPGFTEDTGAEGDLTLNGFGAEGMDDAPPEGEESSPEEGDFSLELEGLDASVPEPEAGEEGFSEVSLEEFLGSPGPAEPPPEEEAGEAEDSGEEPPDFSPPEEPESPGPGGPDLSTELLVKIAGELSSIKSELTSLKEEFSVFRAGMPAAPESPAPAHGFFDEEEDEKIALTGDELNHIINTADFTEETGTDVADPSGDGGEAPPGEEDLSPGSFEEDGEALFADGPGDGPGPDFEEPGLELGEFGSGLGESGLESEEPGLELEEPGSGPGESGLESEEPGLELEEPGSGPGEPMPDFGESGPALEEALLEEPALAELREEDFAIPDRGREEGQGQKPEEEEEALPVVLPPEDTGYLDEEPGEDGFLPEPFGEDSPALPPEEEDTVSVLDFPGEAPEEPDLSLDIQENSLEEPGTEDLSDELSADLSFEDTPLEDTPFEDISLEEPVLEDSPLGSTALEDTSIDLDLEEMDENDSLSLDEGGAVETDAGEEEELSLDGFLPGPTEGLDERAVGLDEQGTEPGDAGEEAVSGDFIGEEAGELPLPSLTELEESLPGEAENIGFLEKSPEEQPGEGFMEPEAPAEPPSGDEGGAGPLPAAMTGELRKVLSYMDRLLESLPEEKIEEFAKSEYFETYKRLFRELGLG